VTGPFRVTVYFGLSFGLIQIGSKAKLPYGVQL